MSSSIDHHDDYQVFRGDKLVATMPEPSPAQAALDYANTHSEDGEFTVVRACDGYRWRVEVRLVREASVEDLGGPK